eukprot:Phypoly_transcript_02110.p1 GENE.Phypoly_transcript_02110~~Phypoly_transcript_02110.p1  ORF type:complete len:867 (+),score=164.15 Phypoly_transcript_02110:311-2602(+)
MALSAAMRKPSRHKLVNEKSQAALVKVPSRERMADAEPTSVTHVPLESVAPDSTMSDLDRDEMQVTYNMLQFEDSQTQVIATADYTDGTLGFSKGQIIEVKCKETDPKDKKVIYTGTFLDPYSKEVEMKFPASVVTTQRAPIARGSYSEIKKAVFEEEEVVAKVMDFSPHPLEAAWNAFRKEIWIMSSISHQSLVSLKAYTVTPPCLILEYMPHGDLYSYINKRNDDGSPAHPLSFKLVLKLAMDIAQGMCYLHCQNPPIIHRDFKSPNILLIVNSENDITAKISDFGLSVPMYSGSLQAEKARERTVVNPLWLAPEILREEQYAISSDVYPFGIILWELLVQKHPFIEGLEHTAFISVLEDAIKEGDRPPLPSDCPSNYAALIKSCWHGTPTCRPTFPEVTYQLTKLMTEYDVPYPFPLGHMKVKELQLMNKDKVQTMLVLEDLQQVWVGTRSGDIIIYSSGNKLGTTVEHKVKAHPSVVKHLMRHESLVYSISKEHATVWNTGRDTSAKGTFGVHPSKNLIISGATITNNQLWCTYHDMSLVCWDLKTRQAIVNVEALFKSSARQHLQGVFTEGSIISSGDLLWISSDTRLLVVDRMSCDVLFIGEEHTKRINALLLANGCVWSGGNDGKLCVWQTPTKEQIGKQQQQVLLHKAGYRAPQGTREQKQLFSSEPLEEFSLSMKPKLILEQHHGPVHCLMQTSTNVWSGGHDKNLFVWDLTPEIKLNRKVYARHQARVSSLAVSGRERELWAGSFDSTVSIWI